jgi:CxxC-x17-CxxC domain-containing protein
MDNEIPHNRDITYFGRTNFRNTNNAFGIKRRDRRQHMYILGKSGTGKSVLLSNLIVQNINNGEGVCVVDPHGELVEEILHLIPDHRAKDVIYFNPADTEFHVGFNVIALDDPKYKHLVASGLMGIFTKIWANAWSSRMEYILNNAILALLDTPGTTLLGIPRLLVDKDYRQMIIGNLKDPVVKAFWVHEYEQWREQFRNEAIAPIQNKVGQFLSTSIIRNVVGQSKSTIDIFKIMNEGKIFLVNVSKGRVGEDNSALLGGMIITKIQLAAMERVRIPEEERKDFYLYVDEFQNFATDSFANILSEARKYRLNLIIAHQYTAQLSNENGTAVRDAVFGNVGTMIIFRVGADDAEFIEKEFEPEFTAQDLVNLPNYHIYLKLMIDGVTSRPFSATTLPPMKIDLAAGIKERIIQSSRDLYTRPRLEVENEIAKWSGMLQTVEGEAKYKADCSNCGKSTMVPFEPKEGRPVYCKDCMFKIKSGELKPQTGFVASRSARQDEKTSTAPLAALGIEFTGVPTVKLPDFKKPVLPAQSLPSAAPSSGFPKGAPRTSNPNNMNQNRNRPNPVERKHSGPSPLLKGLLQQIGADNKSNIPKEEVEIKITPTPAPMSLASLKKNNPASDLKNGPHPKTPVPTKEASEEKKASLKELLARATASQADKTNTEVKIEPVVTKVIETKPVQPMPEKKIEQPQEKIAEKFVEKPIENREADLPKPEIKKEEGTLEKKEDKIQMSPMPVKPPEIPQVKVIETQKTPESSPAPSQPQPVNQNVFIHQTTIEHHTINQNIAPSTPVNEIKMSPPPTPPSSDPKPDHLPNVPPVRPDPVSWQKQTVTKEVPEDILRKVLE